MFLVQALSGVREKSSEKDYNNDQSVLSSSQTQPIPMFNFHHYIHYIQFVSVFNL